MVQNHRPNLKNIENKMQTKVWETKNNSNSITASY